MPRSLKKGPFVDEKLYRKVEKARAAGSHDAIRTWARACTIVPEFIGVNFLVHNGKTFNRVLVTEDMVGHKLGEFAPTRVFRGHGGKLAERAGDIAFAALDTQRLGEQRGAASERGQDRGDHGGHGPLAVGAGDVDVAAALVRVPQGVKEIGGL